VQRAAYDGQGEIAVTPCPSALPGHPERELLEEGRAGFLIDPLDREFFLNATPEQIRKFFAALQ